MSDSHARHCRICDRPRATVQQGEAYVLTGDIGARHGDPGICYATWGGAVECNDHAVDWIGRCRRAEAENAQLRKTTAARARSGLPR